ncbi:monovalent cation/H+ antiporter subunit A [Methylobacterium oxalidis]|uniref:K(+)/H(+) antiporter subunit A/B n=1 Tax=Methylobacterium oxalidis TaxID=944322 RepID=A0A512JBK0_9HYPH|nr:monovalent cation/H+ antiporter subunit A [Methylobacterium oxalidis]GEP07326.1 putative K(+)/H(+) antiporter subunit A/B [Methylobacterium oxalidis]GJE34556.1 NAD(P)H-quinone oxidoreductase subunit 2, chloroplastic [Methylobacterium oxalidis]GLS64466.1 putative K(+)/H(+) antiporter subunit A/B [Methylobacterium oxalidis]
MPQEMLLIAIVMLPFVGSCLAALLQSNARNAETWLAGATALTCLVLVSTAFPAIAAGGIIRNKIEWLPEFGLDFTLRVDGFAWMFAVLITGIGFLVVLYARYYMSPTDPVPRFFSFLLAFMGAMLGIVLSGNLIQLVFFWELTSLFSFLLIGYWHQNAPARDGARMALTVTSAGGLCLFAGVLLVGHIVGTYDLDRVLASGHLIRSHHLYIPTLLLVLLGALTKSAQFPFHFWLPHAMAAPTPVSAYLHSATMVKAGVFLLIRLWPALGGTDEWLWLVGSAGLITFILGAYIAIFQQDLKGLLAYSTISHLGLITLLIGLDAPLGIVAAIFHILNHATFKASLFMAAGIIDHESGTRDIRRLSGLWRFMPVTATLAMVAAAAMAGVPLLNGFLSKEMFFAETIETHNGSLLDDALPYIVTLASTCTVAYSLRFIRDVFFGPPPTGLPRTPHEPPRWMRFPVELLVLACLVVGIIPSMTVGPALDAAVRAVLGGDTPEYSLAIWHGFTPELLMSILAMSGGVALYFALHGYLLSGVEGPPLLRRLNGQRIFERILVFLSWRLARRLENLLGTRRLQPQLRLLVGMALLAGAAPFYAGGFSTGRPVSDIDPGFALVWAVGAACAIGAAHLAKFHRLAALVLLGGAGLVACISFVWLSAPDLALTQLVVETVTTVLLLLGLRWLPKRIPEAGAMGWWTQMLQWHRARDLTLALCAGAAVAALAYAAMTEPVPDRISRFFVENAYTQGGGTNIVNVILVDFRGFDTLGEITVLGVVALTVYALLRRFRPAAESVPLPEQQRIQNAYDDEHPERATGDTIADAMTIPALIMRLMFPVIGVVALFFFLRGHDLPGGGFVAGLTMAVAFILQYMAGGTHWFEARLRILPLRWMGFGLLVAAGTGAAAWLFGRPFLTSYFAYANVPLIGPVPLASVLLFDLGVFSLVVGATVLMLIAIAHQSVRSHRAAPQTRGPRPQPAPRRMEVE